jgi:hypothetical protein
MEKMHNEKLHDLYTSPNVTANVLKLRRIRWVRHAARMGEMRN